MASPSNLAERRRRAAARLWLPRTAQPKERCNCCGKPFFDGEERALVTHVKECAAEYAAIHSLRVKNPVLMDPFDASRDVELERWVKSNKSAILQGKKTY